MSGLRKRQFSNTRPGDCEANFSSGVLYTETKTDTTVSFLGSEVHPRLSIEIAARSLEQMV